jgi:ubiquinol-cytochrome c reductase iron-sulfur subunit
VTLGFGPRPDGPRQIEQFAEHALFRRTRCPKVAHGSTSMRPARGEMTSGPSNLPSTRRDFLTYATVGAGAVAVGAAVRGLGASLAPSAGQFPPVLIDLSGIAEGSEISVVFDGKPIVVRHRSAQDIAAAEAVDVGDLIDPLARNLNLAADAAATDQNRRATPDGRFIVMSRSCTHMGCVVLGDRMGDFGGYFCPCHSGHYDTAGRIRKGPPPRNLPIPAFRMQTPEIMALLPWNTVRAPDLDRLIYG